MGYSAVHIFFVGLGISFLGALPLGNLNVSATQIAVSESNKKAWYFALAVALIEILYVRLSLQGLRYLVDSPWFLMLQWVSVAVFLLLGIVSIRAARKQQDQKPVLLRQRMHRFLLGALMSALNPAQFPFWIVWSSTLISQQVLNTSASSFNWYTAGIGTGTLLALGLFIHAGSYLIKRRKWGERALQWILAAVFLLSAGIQAWRLVYGI